MNEYGETARYLCRAIDDGRIGVGLNWKGVIAAICAALGRSEGEIGKALLWQDIGYRGNLDAEFLVHGIYDANIPSDEKEAAFEKILEKIREEPYLASMLIMISTEYNMTLELVDYLLHDDKLAPPDLIDNPYAALVTSDLFLESEAVNRFIKNEAGNLSDRTPEVITLAKENWFLNLLDLLRPGSHGSVQPLATAFQAGKGNSSGQNLLYGLVSNGTLPWLMLNRGRILKEKAVIEAFRRKQQADAHERHIRKLYYWLGIANDFVLGMLFLVGSIEFLPNGDEIAGVIMFIIGSAQLVGRSALKIAMNLHLKSSRKRAGLS